MKKKQLMSLIGAVAGVVVLGAIAYFVSIGGFSQTKSQAGLARESVIREWNFNKSSQRAGWTVVGKSSGAIDKNGVLVIGNIKAQPIVLSSNDNSVRAVIKGKTTLRLNTSFIPAAVTLDYSRTQTAGGAYIDIMTKKPVDFMALPLSVTAKYTDNKGNVVTLGTKTLTGDAKEKFQVLDFDFFPTPEVMPLPTGMATTQVIVDPVRVVPTINLRRLTFEFGYKVEPVSISIDSISIVQTVDVAPTPIYKTSPGTPIMTDPIAPSGQPQ